MSKISSVKSRACKGSFYVLREKLSELQIALPDTLSLVPTVRVGVAGGGPGVVHTSVHQAPELVAQPGAVAVVQAGHLRPLLLQGVPHHRADRQPEAEPDQAGEQRHVTAAAPATLHAAPSSPWQRILTSSFVF